MSKAAWQCAAVAGSLGTSLLRSIPATPVHIASYDGVCTRDRNRLDRPIEAQSHPI
ncbi:MAG: hypothetical protein QOH69_2186 [Actinomycetota bacterium]|jgi:hypothetical protein|nr:hypothetical protein [Actinomycetota bacterium]